MLIFTSCDKDDGDEGSLTLGNENLVYSQEIIGKWVDSGHDMNKPITSYYMFTRDLNFSMHYINPKGVDDVLSSNKYDVFDYSHEISFNGGDHQTLIILKRNGDTFLYMGMLVLRKIE